MDDIVVQGDVTLGSFLKISGAAATGGHAKILIQSGDVMVNGRPEPRRGTALRPGDVVAVAGRQYRVCRSSA
jgi:ribosome-associated protein